MRLVGSLSSRASYERARPASCVALPALASNRACPQLCRAISQCALVGRAAGVLSSRTICTFDLKRGKCEPRLGTEFRLQRRMSILEMLERRHPDGEGLPSRYPGSLQLRSRCNREPGRYSNQSPLRVSHSIASPVWFPSSGA